MAVTPHFWRNKRVLLTGHTGFKGSWLALWLESMGAELRGMALPPATRPNLFELASVADGMDSEFTDIRDFDAVRMTVERFKPEVVLHLAAQPLVRYSYKNPVETYATNVMGLVHLLEAVRQLGETKVVVNVTTDKCYENKEWVWPYRENEPLGGHDPYSSSKGCSELVTSAYRRSYLAEAEIGLASARAGNVVGGGDWSEDRLVPDVLRAFACHESVYVRNPNAIRPWQHVLEPLSGYLTLAEKLWDEPIKYADGWNFGPAAEDAKTVGWIVQRMVHLWGDGASWRIDEGQHPHEANTLMLDISKARRQLGWRPRLGLDRALEMIVDWEKMRLSGGDMRAITLSQIEAFVDMGYAE